MGAVAYNRDERIRNKVLDAVIAFNDDEGVSATTIRRWIVRSESAFTLGEFSSPRVNHWLGRLVEYGALEAVDGEVTLFKLGAVSKVVEVARGRAIFS